MAVQFDLFAQATGAKETFYQRVVLRSSLEALEDAHTSHQVAFFFIATTFCRLGGLEIHKTAINYKSLPLFSLFKLSIVDAQNLRLELALTRVVVGEELHVRQQQLRIIVELHVKIFAQRHIPGQLSPWQLCELLPQRLGIAVFSPGAARLGRL
jgi:hypothetical protein